MTALASFLEHLRASCADDSFVRLSLSSPSASAAPLERVLVRLVALRGDRQLSLTLRERRRDTTHNLAIDDGIAEIAQRLRTQFAGALLATTAADWQLQLGGERGDRLIRHRASSPTAPVRQHDEKKPTLLGETAQPWLAGLGIVDALGRPRRNLADKHAQIARYVEILAHLARDCGFGAADAADRTVRLVDVGCGKGHLTFAAWHLLKNVLECAPVVHGVETRGELVDGANQLAQSLGIAAEVQFVGGDIGTVELPPFDVLVALHACNTATDAAIRRGVQGGARLVVVAPCCHQEVRPQLASPEPLAAALRHGLLAERMAEWATDALRAMVLEWAGYRTKVIEFVGSEHTPKNVMLAAVRTDPLTPAARQAARQAIARFREFFGIGHCALDELLAGDPGA